ncbi:MAG: hypothetical protein AAF235_00650 [Planctomycetota bacterium]
MNRSLIALIAACGACPPALAQDSISNLGTGLPGDAPDPFDVVDLSDPLFPDETGDQVDRYVVDLVPIATTWGTNFGVAPILKTPNSDGSGGFFASLGSAHAISQDTITVTLPETSFALWENAPGVGVNANNQESENFAFLSGNVLQQAVAISSFSGNNETLSSALINIDPAAPGRLYVTRILAATNQASLNASRSYDSGVGGVDANGNVVFRLDNNSGGTNAVQGNNLVRVASALRSADVINQITGAGVTGADAGTTEGVIRNFGNAITPGTIIPQSVAGGLGIPASLNFDGEYVYGPSFGATSATTGHLSGGGAASVSSPRGTTTFSPFSTARLGGVGMFTHLVLDGNIDGDSDTGAINVFGADAMGNPQNRAAFDPPNVAALADPANGSTIDTRNGRSINHLGATAFRGGSAATAATALADGTLIAAVTHGFTAGGTRQFDDPDNYIVAFRELADGTVESTPVAYAQLSGPNKEILDGPGGNVIGELIPFDEAFPTANALGPSMSAPSIDSAGNIWFVSTFKLDSFGPLNTGDSGLFRAVYDADTFSYELELVLELGQIITGANSGTPYVINFIGLAQNNGGISSGGFWSSNVNKFAALGADRAGIDPASALSNGGVILSATITYDADGDMDFDDPTSANGDPSSNDEEYPVLLYVGSLDTPEPPCPFDVNGDGSVNLFDVDAFRTFVSNDDLTADFNGNGVVDSGDIAAFTGPFTAIFTETTPCSEFIEQ